MVAAVMRNDFPRPLADDVQVLIDAEPKPGAGKRESRPRDRLQLEHVAIEGHAPLDVGNVNGNVIELTDKHAGRTRGITGEAYVQFRRFADGRQRRNTAQAINI